MGNLMGQIWKKCFLYRHISIFQLILCRKHSFYPFRPSLNDANIVLDDSDNEQLLILLPWLDFR